MIASEAANEGDEAKVVYSKRGGLEMLLYSYAFADETGKRKMKVEQYMFCPKTLAKSNSHETRR